MIEVTFVQPDGEAATYYGRVGETLMDVALDNGVQGILAQCGGGCTCCTCHGYIDTAFLQHLPNPRNDEVDMLEYAWQPKSNSRLLCQIPLSTSLQGVRVCVPARQFD